MGDSYVTVTGSRHPSDLERGKRNPTVVTLYEWATALGVSHVELVRADRGLKRR